MAVLDKIISLTRQLLPTGRAFKAPIGGAADKLYRGLARSEVRAYNDAVSILDAILPDNDNFSTEDATQWETRLGLISNPAVSLADRKLAILRKINHPGTIPARQHYLYLEKQLQDAGFNVYVHENRFPAYPDGYETKTPVDFSLTTYPTVDQQHGDQIQHGDVQHGGTYGNKIVNHIEQSLDDPFDLGSNLKSTFFVGGQTPGTYANVDTEREPEFRQLILRVKPVQTAGFLLINYV